MPRLVLISSSPNHPTVAVELTHEEARRLEVENVSPTAPAPVLTVTLDLDWSIMRKFYQRAFKRKGGQVVLGGGVLKIKRTYP
jgi:hypothetical protein